MPTSSTTADLHLRLLPEGRRWGFGARSVVPYLTAAMQARPGEPVDIAAAIRNPVFQTMEKALGALRKQY